MPESVTSPLWPADGKVALPPWFDLAMLEASLGQSPPLRAGSRVRVPPAGAAPVPGVG